MPQASPIPLYIEMRRLYRPADRYEHQLKFGVVGVAEPAVVIVESDLFDDPTVSEHLGDGSTDLPVNLFDSLALKCFRLVASMAIEYGGESGRWSIPDITTLIQKQFTHSDAEQLIDVLSQQVTEGLSAANACVLADDDAI